tara:strand:- start:7002 stop:8153 length:1152 start_codon:yes stop_codon:yes gene_type:complete
MAEDDTNPGSNEQSPSAYSIGSDFDSQKYPIKEDSNLTSLPYVRASDEYANKKKAFLSFMHVPSQTQIYFKAFITTFTETYNSDWTAENVYGRADPIYLFRNTTRKITLGFEVLAESKSEAYQNLGRVQKLLQFLYPNYTTLTDPVTGQNDAFAQTISQSPLVRLKIMNLLHNQASEQNAGDYNDYVITGSSAGKGISTGASNGVLGAIDNITVNHNLENSDYGVFKGGEGIILPKIIDVNVAFSPIHEHPVGWRPNPTGDSGSPFLTPIFPYGVNLEANEPPETDTGANAIAGAPSEPKSEDSETGSYDDEEAPPRVDVDPPNQAALDDPYAASDSTTGEQYIAYGDDPYATSDVSAAADQAYIDSITSPTCDPALDPGCGG